MQKPLACLLLGISFAMAPAAAFAQNVKPLPKDPLEDPLLMSAGFLSAHPDLRYRQLGIEAFKAQKFEDAYRYFQRGAYYADKAS